MNVKPTPSPSKEGNLDSKNIEASSITGTFPGLSRDLHNKKDLTYYPIYNQSQINEIPPPASVLAFTVGQAHEK